MYIKLFLFFFLFLSNCCFGMTPNPIIPCSSEAFCGDTITYDRQKQTLHVPVNDCLPFINHFSTLCNQDCFLSQENGYISVKIEPIHRACVDYLNITSNKNPFFTGIAEVVQKQLLLNLHSKENAKNALYAVEAALKCIVYNFAQSDIAYKKLKTENENLIAKNKEMQIRVNAVEIFKNNNERNKIKIKKINEQQQISQLELAKKNNEIVKLNRESLENVKKIEDLQNENKSMINQVESLRKEFAVLEAIIKSRIDLEAYSNYTTDLSKQRKEDQSYNNSNNNKNISYLVKRNAKKIEKELHNTLKNRDASERCQALIEEQIELKNKLRILEEQSNMRILEEQSNNSTSKIPTTYIFFLMVGTSILIVKTLTLFFRIFLHSS